MKKKIKKIVEEVIKELMAGGSSVDGDPSFRGGPYGIGNKKQLATVLDPSVQAIEDQEQAEINQNIEDQDWSLRKFKKSTPMPPNSQLKERNDADARYSHLPGFPRMNALETPVMHVPDENFVVNDLRAGRSDRTEEYLIDDIVDELETYGEPEYLKTYNEQGAAGGYNFVDQQKSALPPFYVKGNEAPEEQDPMSHLSHPPAEHTAAGGYGAVIFPKKFVPDDHVQQSNLDDDNENGIADNIDTGKAPELLQRVKEERTNKMTQQPVDEKRHPKKYGEKPPSEAQIKRKFKEAGRSLLDLGIELGKTHNTFNDETANEVMYLLSHLRKIEKDAGFAIHEEAIVNEEELDEKYASKAQQRYFHAMANKPGKTGKKWKKMSSEFDKATPSFKDLPARAKHEAVSLNVETIKRMVKEEILKHLKEEKKE